MKLNLCILTEFYPPQVLGGGEYSVQMLAQSLRKAGHRVTVLTSNLPDLPKDEICDGLKIRRYVFNTANPTTIWGSFLRTIPLHHSVKKQLKKLRQQEKFDLIHVYNVTGIVGAIAALKNIVPIVTTVNCHTAFCPLGTRLDHHGKIYKNVCTFSQFWKMYRATTQIGHLKNPWYLKYNLPLALYIYWNFSRIRRAFRRADFVFGVSSFVVKIAARHCSKEKVALVPAIIDLKNFAKSKNEREIEMLKKRFETNNSRILLSVSPLTHIKGIDVLIKAVAEVKKPNIKLIIVGDGRERLYLEKLAQELGISKKIIFVGAIDHAQIPNFYCIADIFLQASRIAEPLSRTLLEAASFNIPIIASNVGGNPDIVHDHQNGFLVGSESAEEFAKAIAVLLNNPIAPKLIAAINQKILENYQPEVVIKRLEMIYRSLANKFMG